MVYHIIAKNCICAILRFAHARYLKRNPFIKGSVSDYEGIGYPVRFGGFYTGKHSELSKPHRQMAACVFFRGFLCP